MFERVRMWQTVFEFRKWPLFCSLQNIFHTFGIDIANYHHQMYQFFFFYLILWVMSLPLLFIYYMNDNITFNTFETNLNPVLEYTPYSNYRGIIWTCVLCVAVIFIRYLGYLRQVLQAEMEFKSKIDDFSVLLLNVPNTCEDYEIKTYIHTQLSVSCIVKYFRVERPITLGAKKKLYKLQKEYYDTMLEHDNVLNRKDFKYYCCKGICMFSMAQSCGFMRDRKYYKKEIEACKKECEKVTNDQASMIDAVIVTLSSVQLANQLVLGIKDKNAPLLRGTKIYAQKSPSPTDLIVENLHYEGRRKIYKIAFSFFQVFWISLAFFILTGFCRYYTRFYTVTTPDLKQENAYYYILFVLQIVFDIMLRPFLYILTNFEKHYSYTVKEKLWMIKLYMYTGLNKLTMYYSRTFMQILNILENKFQASFFDIFGFTSAWRNDLDSGGRDAVIYTFTAVILYNILDLLEFTIYFTVLCFAARTRNDKIGACKSLNERYSSKYVCVIVLFTFMLSFGHANPKILFYAAFYFLIQDVVARTVLLRMSSPPPNTFQISAQGENLMYFAVLFASLNLCQSYLQINRFWKWFFILMPFMMVWIFAVKAGIFDFVIKKLGGRYKFALQRDIEKSFLNLDLENCESYTLFKQEVNDEMILDLEQLQMEQKQVKIVVSQQQQSEEVQQEVIQQSDKQIGKQQKKKQFTQLQDKQLLNEYDDQY